ncbi:helix-turn-helix domain-containing protein [Desulforudis sp. 1088]|uniref:helix-turn-helix domain-containing protein n=1 Tax=unclassified Candidatus Desulforudis TaxID=2635950 RepID=UPI003CE50B9F
MWDDYELKASHLGMLQKAGNPAETGECPESCILNYTGFSLPPDGLPLKEYNDRIILKALEMHKGNKTKTAKYLGISRRSLECRLKHLM